MPHFIVDCSEKLLSEKPPADILQTVHKAAADSGLFALSGPGGIKVRIRPHRHYSTVGSDADFIHVFGNIMEGRSVAQKKALSTAIVSSLSTLFPDLEIVSMNVQEFERATYCNKAMLSREA